MTRNEMQCIVCCLLAVCLLSVVRSLLLVIAVLWSVNVGVCCMLSVSC